MKLTIIYDNTTRDRALTPDWGFACLVETADKKILFDTGARGNILLDNMNKLGLDPLLVDEMFISHDHWDHTGGMADFFAIKQVPCYVPQVFTTKAGPEAIRVGSKVQKLHDKIWSTGTLAAIEHALVIEQDRGGIVIAGCSHPGVGTILEAAGKIGRVSALIGGLHGFSNLEAIRGLDLVCPTHCTQHIQPIADQYPDIYVAGGAGRTLTV
ncbi:MAG: MBL fold metallo-hydrolase [Desulfosudaceae bacterium]